MAFVDSLHGGIQTGSCMRSGISVGLKGYSIAYSTNQIRDPQSELAVYILLNGH